MNYTVEHEGRVYAEMSKEELIANEVPLSKIGAEAKSLAITQIAVFAESYRSKLASTSAGKLAEYRIKEEIARDPSVADDAELLLLDREAEAMGVDRAALLAVISAKATAFRQIALLIGVLEVEAKAAIFAIADDVDDIQANIEAVLSASVVAAKTAFEEAQTLLNG